MRRIRSEKSSTGDGFIAVIHVAAEEGEEDGAERALLGLGLAHRSFRAGGRPLALLPGGLAEERAPARAVVALLDDRPQLAAEVLSAIRAHPGLSAAPALASVLASHVADLDPAAGFDDFVLAPSEPRELYARIHALESRGARSFDHEKVTMGAIVVDKRSREVMLDGRVVSLTAKEFDLLWFFTESRGRAFSREQIFGEVWGDRLGCHRVLDVYVGRLRSKLGDALPLETVRGSGYRLRTSEPRVAVRDVRRTEREPALAERHFAG